MVCAAFEFSAQRMQPAIILTIIGALIALYVLWEWLKPYSQFQTKRNETRAKWANWLLGGVLTFLLFSVAGVFFRKRLLGF